ncbi:FAD-dependent monooxygenase [Nocardioides sp. J54]|uniref:FAD-dependent monooxygenase n=1 Tax=Nocardioides sp. J54 TaxID=935866 RepID=UPI00048AD81B|nr:FAD-dependent monooxygenase [Nocardioides sp. J54]
MTARVTDVAVVGAGTAGLATALGLARSGVAVTLVDTAAGSSTRPGPTWSGVHHWSVLPILDRLGVLDAALVAGEATASWGISVLATGERLVFDLRELGPEAPYPFNLRLEPARLRAILRDALLDHRVSIVDAPGIDGLRQYVDGAVLTLPDGRGIAADWVVGADGPASGVRRATGLGFEGTTWTERGVVAVVDHDFTRQGYADTTLQVDGRAGAVVERLGPSTWRYVCQESLALDEASVALRLRGVLRRVTGGDPEVLGLATARMHQRSATSYRAGRVVLVAAAAHVTHPLAGHTSLTGWHDGATLVPVLHDALRAGVDDRVTAWADGRRRVFLDEAAPMSLARRNLIAQIDDPARLAVELDAFRRASADPQLRRELLRAEHDAVAGDRSSLPPL